MMLANILIAKSSKFSLLELFPQPSPTTGAFALPHLAFESGAIKSDSSSADNDSDDTSSFTFNPHGMPIPLSGYPAVQNQVGTCILNLK